MDDTANCGSCEKVCGVGEICNTGVCTPGTGGTYCNGNLVNISYNDGTNCGQCGKACPSGTSCISGICTTETVVTFGNYYQSNATTKEPIQWRVLEIDSVNHKKLLLSVYVLDAKPYHTSRTSITWEGSTLRTWLNNDFLNTAFSETERAKILTTHLNNPDSLYGTAGGNATDDKVFLLGLSDVYGENSHYSAGNWYFNNNNDRMAMATWYAVNKGVYAYNYDTSKTCNNTNYHLNKCSAVWWLRSPGNISIDAAHVYIDGSANYYGDYVSNDSFGVRPALWVEY